MRVALVAPPGVQSLDIVGPAEVFWEAARRLGNPSAYEIQIIGTQNGPVCGTGSLRFLVDGTIHDQDEPIDTLLVGGDPAFEAIDPVLTQWLARRAPQTRRFGSICTGVFLLAAAGLLDGRHVTTHWECAKKLQRDYPCLTVDADKIFIRDQQLYTAAGVTAGIDLALALVEEDYGRQLALTVARYMVVFLKRPGGQSQFSAQLSAQICEKTSIEKVLDHVLENQTADLSIDVLAHQAGMSKRNFARVFHSEVGMTPTNFVETTRLDAARRMLEDTSQPLQRVAQHCGFRDLSAMRRVFQRNLGVGPLDYRRHFQGAAPKSVANVPRQKSQLDK